ncbi:HAD hydrolase-like protein [Methylocapsa sp. S129]|uniref:HAD hydrolase-like protein n=1 Tax=Methylocapsa sp. S129 TaxID=1641869 RepID=UPI00131DAD42|nr:HAD hydrolase-like protein [Methylocapsa sp. S129]
MSSAGIAIFDLDGTLTDSRPGILRSTRYALGRLNETTGKAIPIPEESALDFMIGPPLRNTFATLVGDDLVEPMMSFYRERYATIGLFENAVYRGVPEALEVLRAAGRRLFVATSKNEADARRVLDHFGLAKFFAEIYGAQSDGGRAIKSDLLTYLLGRERIAANPANVVMIGDRKYDVLGAKAVGIAAIGALWGYGGQEELSEAGADALAETPQQIPATVEGLTRAAG